VSAACGKKGPPLAPLHLVPEPPANVTARRLGDTVYVQMTAPRRNANGPGPVALDHLEVYAITAAAGATPPNRDLLNDARIVARIPIKPAPDPDAEPPAEDAPKDTRPAPGDTITFTETLTDALLKPQFVAPAKPPASAAITPSGGAAPPSPGAPPVTPATTPGSTTTPEKPSGTTTAPPSTAPPATPPPASPSPTTAPVTPPAATGEPSSTPGTTATAPAAPASAFPTRVYLVRGVAKGGRSGAPSTRVAVPLIAPPPPPAALTTAFNETAVAVGWLPPVVDSGTTLPLKFNVYRAAAMGDAEALAAPAPLNDAPLEATGLEHAGAEPGVEQCFVVRSVETVGGATLESAPSARACVTPRDTFAPAAPKNLSAVAGPGAINLIWDANTEGDLAGYIVLRAQAPGDTLQPLNPQPSRETRYRDTAVTAGARYVYAVVAVDSAGNRSASSARVEETAR
jgi:hypothetical protein